MAAAAASPFFEMEFEHQLLLMEEQKFPDFLLPDLPPPPGCEATASSDLVPLPDSLCEFHNIPSQYLLPDPVPEHSAALVPYDPECNLQYYSAASQFGPVSSLDDIDLDYFSRTTDSSPQCTTTTTTNTNNNNEQYRVVSNDTAAAAAASACGYGGVHGAVTWENKGSIMVSSSSTEKRSESSRSRLNGIGFDEMKNYFYMPITKAAREMNVGLTVLKKRCRELGISRWPHRKMKSLKSLIHNVQELGQGSSEETIRKELVRLDEYRRMMEDNPEMQLTERTKKLRQACFKANYKRRRLVQDPCSFDIHRRCYSYFAN